MDNNSLSTKTASTSQTRASNLATSSSKKTRQPTTAGRVKPVKLVSWEQKRLNCHFYEWEKKQQRCRANLPYNPYSRTQQRGFQRRLYADLSGGRFLWTPRRTTPVSPWYTHHNKPLPTLNVGGLSTFLSTPSLNHWHPTHLYSVKPRLTLHSTVDNG